MNPTYFTLGQAAKETGKSKSVISKALKDGALSYFDKTKAGYKIDPAELFRVFPKQSMNSVKEQLSTLQKNTENAVLQAEHQHLKQLLEDRDKRMEELRQDRDAWKDQAEINSKLIALLEDQSKKLSLWQRIFGRD